MYVKLSIDHPLFDVSLSSFFNTLVKITTINYFSVFIDLFRLASKTTDVNWRKEKDTAQLHSYYENRQFKWFNPRGIDYSNLSDKRGAPDYRN